MFCRGLKCYVVNILFTLIVWGKQGHNFKWVKHLQVCFNSKFVGRDYTDWKEFFLLHVYKFVMSKAALGCLIQSNIIYRNIFR